MSDEILYPDYLSHMPDEVKELWDSLDDQRRKFCVFYVECGNGALAARRSGYSSNGDYVQAHRLLINAKVKPIVDWMTNYVIQNSLDTSIVTKREIQQKLSRMFTANQSNFLKNGCIDIEEAIKNGNIEALAELTTRRIDGNEFTESATIEKIKLHDPVKIAQELNKMQGNYEATGIHHSGQVENKLDPSQIKDAIKEVLSDDDC